MLVSYGPEVLDLVVRGSKSAALFSKEGVTQGDPLSMFIFAVGSLPLIWSLNSIKEVTQVWYADDASSVEVLMP